LARAEALADITKATQHMSKPDNLYLSANHHMYSMARINPFESNTAEAAAAAAAAAVVHHHHHHPNAISEANNNSFYNALYWAHHQNISSANSNLTQHQAEVTTTTPTTKSNSQPDIDPRDLEAFAEKFKQRRIKLGVTQADVGLQLTKLKLPGVGSLSQSTICRFESLTLSHNNMIALKPILQSWLEQAEVDNRLKRKNDEVMSTSSSICTTSSISSLSFISNNISSNNINHNSHNGNSNNFERERDRDHDRDRIRERERDRKRKRTSIAAPEKRSLETYFTIQPRPSGEKIAQIAEKLDLKKNVVRVWFCNQRQKQKRMKFASGSSKQHDAYNSS
jgi:POU domain transcription factor, class 4